MKKRRLIIFLIIVSMMASVFSGLLACKKSDEDILNEAVNNLSLGDVSELTQKEALPFIEFIPPRHDMKVTWSIEDGGEDYINLKTGLITQPEWTEEDVTFEITAEVTYKGLKKTKKFNATVVKQISPALEEYFFEDNFSAYADSECLVCVASPTWSWVSGKQLDTGETYRVVDTVGGETVPNWADWTGETANAVQVISRYEEQVSTALPHNGGEIVIEVDLYQEANGSPIRFQSQTSGTGLQIGFGAAKADASNAKFYFTGSGNENKDYNGEYTYNAALNKWYTMRAEIDLNNLEMEVFIYNDHIYDDGLPLTAITPEKIKIGSTLYDTLYVRSGSSTNTTYDGASYFTNIRGNNPIALERPDYPFEIGEITGIFEDGVGETADNAVQVEMGTSFTPPTPVVREKYASRDIMVKDTDYSLTVNNPVNVEDPNEYTVTYTFNNLKNTADSKVITQYVEVYGEVPNEWAVSSSITNTLVNYEDGDDAVTDITFKSKRKGGIIYYMVNTSETSPTPADLKTGGTELQLNDTKIAVAENISIPWAGTHYIHALIENEYGSSAVSTVAISKQTYQEITTTSGFMEMLANPITGAYYQLTSDLDFSSVAGWAMYSGDSDAFDATFNGGNHIVKNITYTNSTDSLYTGIFGKLNGTIKNLKLENITFNTSAAGRGAALVGEIESGNTAHIENIALKNISINASYSAALIGRIRGGTEVTIKNVSVVGATIDASGSGYNGGLISYVEGNANITDVFMTEITVNNGSSTSDRRAGVLGRVGTSGNLTASRIYANATVKSGGVHAAIFLSRNQGTVSVSDVFVTGAVVDVPTSPQRVGDALIAQQESTLALEDNNWYYNFTVNGVTRAEAQAAGVLAGISGTELTTAPNEAWWNANMASYFYEGSQWTVSADGTYVYLSNAAGFLGV